MKNSHQIFPGTWNLINIIYRVFSIRLLVLLLAAGCWAFTRAAATTLVAVPATVTPPVDSWEQIKLAEFVKLSPKAFSRLTGKKMNITERAAFGLMKLKMKRAMKNNPELTVKDFMASYKKMKTWLLVVIIVLGAFLLAFLIFAAAYGGAFN